MGRLGPRVVVVVSACVLVVGAFVSVGVKMGVHSFFHFLWVGGRRVTVVLSVSSSIVSVSFIFTVFGAFCSSCLSLFFTTSVIFADGRGAEE